MFLILGLDSSFAQIPNKYGLSIISDPNILKETIQKDPNKALVRIKDYVPNIALDIKYATTQNVFYTQLYKKPAALVRLPIIVPIV
jgi:D-alanyl-D-alanine dipeptidase